MTLNEREKRSVHEPGGSCCMLSPVSESLQHLGSQNIHMEMYENVFLITEDVSVRFSFCLPLHNYIEDVKNSKSIQIICHKNTSLLVKKFRSFEKNICCLNRDSLFVHSQCKSGEVRCRPWLHGRSVSSSHLFQPARQQRAREKFISSKLISHPRLQSLLLRSLAAAALRASTESEPHA